MAQADYDLGLKRDKNLKANMEIFMAPVNSEKMFDLQI
jgi:hypothetical protein